MEKFSKSKLAKNLLTQEEIIAYSYPNDDCDSRIHPQAVFDYLHLNKIYDRLWKLDNEVRAISSTNEHAFINITQEFDNINIDMTAFEQQSVWERPVDHYKNIGKIGLFWNDRDRKDYIDIGFLKAIGENPRYKYEQALRKDLSASCGCYENFRLLTEEEKKRYL